MLMKWSFYLLNSKRGTFYLKVSVTTTLMLQKLLISISSIVFIAKVKSSSKAHKLRHKNFDSNQKDNLLNFFKNFWD